MTTELEGKLLKAKIELMTRSAFISTIALSLKHVITSDTQTADVNGYVIRYNPDFIKGQSVAQFAGLVAHECWHVAFQHLSRRGSRDPIIWNCAGDYIINHMLTKAGFEIPTGGLLDTKYDGDWSTDQVYNELIKDKVDFDTGTLMLDLNEDGAPEDDGGLGSSITNTIVRARTQAQISGEEKAGLIPNEILRRIDELLNPKLPWQVILYKFLDQRIKDEYSWARRNRRYNKDYMPSLHSYGLGNLTFAIDTSGSIDDDELKDMLSEIRGIQQVFNPEAMTIIDCDSQIHQVHEIDQNTDIMELQFAGGGGTRFQPVLDYVEKHPTQALIYFTDLEGEGNLSEVDYPVIWVCTSEHEPSNIGETIYMNN